LLYQKLANGRIVHFALVSPFQPRMIAFQGFLTVKELNAIVMV
jgi:hypothetical protein